MQGSRLNRFFLVGGYVLLAATAALLLRAARAPGHATAPPPDLTAGDTAGPLVAVVFRLRDCGARIEQLTAWNPADGAAATRVVGYVTDPPRDGAEVTEVLSGSGIRFPVRRSGSEYFARLLPQLGYRKTPVAVVFDAAGQVRLAVPLDDGFKREHVRGILGFARSLAAPPVPFARGT